MGYWAAKFFVGDGAKIIGIVEHNSAIFNPEGIDNLVTIKKYPDDEALADPKITRIITNEARDICKDIECWARQETDNNQKQETDNNQSDPNDSNSN